MYPEDLKYTAEHEWIRVLPADDASAGGATVQVGITHYAQDALGDIVFVTLPDVGASVDGGTPCGEVESTKSVSDVYSPVSGVVTAANEELETSPDLVNSDPYGQGWLFEVHVDDLAIVATLLDRAGYLAMIDAS